MRHVVRTLYQCCIQNPRGSGKSTQKRFLSPFLDLFIMMRRTTTFFVLFWSLRGILQLTCSPQIKYPYSSTFMCTLYLYMVSCRAPLIYCKCSEFPQTMGSCNCCFICFGFVHTLRQVGGCSRNTAFAGQRIQNSCAVFLVLCNSSQVVTLLPS